MIKLINNKEIIKKKSRVLIERIILESKVNIDEKWILNFKEYVWLVKGENCE